MKSLLQVSFLCSPSLLTPAPPKPPGRPHGGVSCRPARARPWAACGLQAPFRAHVLRTWGQRPAPLGRSGSGALPGRRSPLSRGLLSGMPGSPRGPWTLTATEATPGLSDFYVLGWWDPLATTGQGQSPLLGTQCCSVPGTRGRPTNVCRAKEDATFVRGRLRPAASGVRRPRPLPVVRLLAVTLHHGVACLIDSSPVPPSR